MYSSNKTNNNKKWTNIGKSRKKTNSAKGVHNKSTKKGREKPGKTVPGKFYWDNHKVGVENGRFLDYSKYFCSCEQLNKLIHKQTLSETEERVLRDMGKRWNKCPEFVLGGRCFTYSCRNEPTRHTWTLEGSDAFRQAALELKFCRRMCRFCKARPGVAEKFKRKPNNTKATEERWNSKNSEKSSTASSTSSGSVFKRPSSGLYNPKQLATQAKAVMPVAKAVKPVQKLYKAEQFPTLNRKKNLVQPKLNLKKPAVGLDQPKHNLQPPVVDLNHPDLNLKNSSVDLQTAVPISQESDAALKLSELSGTDLSHPIGTKSMSESVQGETYSVSGSVRSEIQHDVYTYSAPSDSSNTSMPMSENQPQATVEPEALVREEKASIAVAPTAAAPVTSEPIAAAAPSVPGEFDPIRMMQQMNSMHAMMRVEMNKLVAENASLRADNASLRATVQQLLGRHGSPHMVHYSS